MFDKVVYINLDSRTDRKEQIENELNKIGITNYERFPAVKHDIPQVGCILSHLNVLKNAREKQYKNILILEDDFEFIVSKEEFWKQIEAIKDVDYDVIMLSYNLINSEEFNDTLFKVIDAHTTSGYLVNSRMYDSLINNYEEAAKILSETKDYSLHALDQYWKRLQPQHKWYGFKVRIGKQRPSYSDLVGADVDYKLGGKRRHYTRSKKHKRHIKRKGNKYAGKKLTRRARNKAITF